MTKSKATSQQLLLPNSRHEVRYEFQKLHTLFFHSIRTFSCIIFQPSLPGSKHTISPFDGVSVFPQPNLELESRQVPDITDVKTDANNNNICTEHQYIMRDVSAAAYWHATICTSAEGIPRINPETRLQSEGFTEEQAVAMMKVLNDVLSESIGNLTRTTVLREDAAKATYTQKVDFAKLRSELIAATSTEADATRSTHERLTNDIAKLTSRLKDDVGRTQASVRLDLNLEKGRTREEAVVQELKIKETEAKIEQEVASLLEKLEQVKFQTLQWLIGVCTGFAALMLGAWRLLM
ncbi:Protein FMP32, mitochondrial [Ceratocystis lukuohia]|uniref:Protein FMP32, mitochondrial n=1 Tax=Ceratocystis lukuohia TaxID=2019550 RepID=A0ABR4MCX5_9PEZI